MNYFRKGIDQMSEAIKELRSEVILRIFQKQV